MSKRIHSFPPVVSGASKVLILGSMPGAESLKRNQYYGHPRNQFWRIVFKLFTRQFSDDYNERINLLQEKNIALWDVYASCFRSGSLDSAIVNGVINDFDSFFSEYPGIRAIFFNGQTACKALKKNRSDFYSIPHVFVLPSTSPAYTISFEKKLYQWAQINRFLQ